MIRTYTYPLRPTQRQARQLTAWLLLCQRLYNAALEQRIHAYRLRKKTLSLYDQHHELTVLRAKDPEYSAVSSLVLRSALHRLDLAFKAFFRRCRAKQTPGFPRFRSADRYDSFAFPFPKLVDSRLRIPNLGCVTLKLHRPLPTGAILREARVRRTCRGWKVALVLDVGPVPAKVPIQSHVGVDMGLMKFAVLSTGEEIQNPRYLRRASDQLAERQRQLARKQRASNSRQGAKRLVARAHEHVRNQRLDHARKLAKNLCTTFDLISIEKLDITQMVERPAPSYPKLAKSIHDVAWRVFFRCLVSKAEEAGKTIIAVDPRGTSQRCSQCGEVEKKTLSDRLHKCKHCGLVLDRDHNAAINIDALGWSAVSTVAKAAA